MRAIEDGLRSILIVLIVLSVILLLGFTSNAQGPSTRELLRDGSKLSETDATKLEDSLYRNSDNPSGHIILIGYYEQLGGGYFDELKRHHVLWLIEHKPDSEILGLREGRLSATFDSTGYFLSRDLWRRQIETQKNNRVVVLNAASFLSTDDTSKVAENILKLANEYAPDASVWQERLAYLYLVRLGNESGSERKAVAAQSLKLYTSAIDSLRSAPTSIASNRSEESKGLPWEYVQLRIQKAAVEKDVILVEAYQNAAWAAFEADQKERARSLASESLSLCHSLLNSGKFKQGDLGVLLENLYSHVGDAFHRGNLILCKIALVESDMISARKYLIESARTPGSSVLRSFGPDMTLAKEMLDRGERDTVVNYLELCDKFWNTHHRDLAIWIKAIKDRKTPILGIGAINDSLTILSQAEFWENGPKYRLK